MYVLLTSRSSVSRLPIKIHVRSQ